jgi:hypothetical protein
VTLKRIISSNDNDDGTINPKLLLQLYQCKKILANDIYQNDIQTPISLKSKQYPNNNMNHDVNGNDGTTNATTVMTNPQQQQQQQESSTSFINDTTGSTNTYHMHRAIRIYQRTVEKLENLIIELQQQLVVPATDKQKDDNNNDVDDDDETNDRNNVIASYIHEAKQLQIDCLNNISAVYMKCHLYHKAKEACVQTLLKDCNNSKALFRAAKAALYDPASSYDEVQAAIRAVQELVVPNTTSLSGSSGSSHSIQFKNDLELLQREYQQHAMKYKQRQKEMAVRIQTKMKQHNATTVPTADSAHSIINKTNTLYDTDKSTKLTSTTTLPDQTDEDVNSNVPDQQSYLQAIFISVTSIKTISCITNCIVYRIVPVVSLFFLLLYIFMYYYITKVTIATTTTSSLSQQNEL